MTRWLVTGAAGQLGSRLREVLAHEDAAFITHAQCDITRAEEVDEVVASVSPDVVVNAAAYTAVDAAESNPELARAVNADGARNVARAVARTGGHLVHVSTDYVFDGQADRPYLPTDPTGPHTVYGQSKLAGELAVRDELPDRHTIVRTAWVMGGPGPNFVATMLRLEREVPVVRVVDDQVGSPTYSRDLAEALVRFAGLGTPIGTVHFANSGVATWFDVARKVFELRRADPARVVAVSSAEYVRPAPRPAWSVLDTQAWQAVTGINPPDWRDAVTRMIDGAELTSVGGRHDVGS